MTVTEKSANTIVKCWQWCDFLLNTWNDRIWRDRDICNSPRRASPMSLGCYNHPKRHWRRHFCKILGCKIISPQAPLPWLRTKYLFFLPLKIKLHSPLKTSIKHWFTPGEYGLILPLKNFMKMKAPPPKNSLDIFFTLPLKKSSIFITYP